MSVIKPFNIHSIIGCIMRIKSIICLFIGLNLPNKVSLMFIMYRIKIAWFKMHFKNIVILS